MNSGKMKAAVVGAALLCGAGAPMAASAGPLTGTFDIKIYQGNGGGNSAAPVEQATNTNPLFTTPGAELAEISYTGALDFTLGSGGINTVAAFLASAGGSYTTIFGAIGSAALSSAPFSLTSLFSITGTTGAISGTVTHDDGASLYQGGSTIFNSQGPTVAIPSAYSLAAGAFNLVYVEANGLPAILDMEVVPEPASLAVLAFGLFGLYLLRRQKYV